MDIDSVDSLFERYDSLNSRIRFLNYEYDKRNEKIGGLNELLDNLNQAKFLMTEVQQAVMVRFKERVESLVTMAINSVYDRKLGFELIFEEKHGQMECRPILYEFVGGFKEIYDDPEDDVGGGLLDVTSIAFRIVLWALEEPKSRPIFWLDEPGKNMGALIGLFGQILKKLSHELHLQMIIITHDQELIEIGDRSFHVTHDDLESRVILIKSKDEIQAEPKKEEPVRRKRK